MSLPSNRPQRRPDLTLPRLSKPGLDSRLPTAPSPDQPLIDSMDGLGLLMVTAFSQQGQRAYGLE
jgi:hypothetical protein